tara:strand:- start:261 stop:476 length:216 start_codon:yes stop_codon:yes gene_type:complete
MKTYEVEFKATTYRQVVVDAKNRDEAEEKAWEELQLDTEASASWVESAEVSQVLDTATENTWMNANGKLKD